MGNINQTIIVRTDLFNLPSDMGLLAAQIAHIHFELMRKNLLNYQNTQVVDMEINCQGYNEWIKEPYVLVKKVCNQEALIYYYDEVVRANLPIASWRDTVYVQLTPTLKKAFPGVLVGFSIGPADSDKIRTIVGDLPLL